MKKKYGCKECDFEAEGKQTCPTCSIPLELLCPGCGKVESECDC